MPNTPLLTSPYVIGVDGGGSKTEAVVLDKQGQVAGRGQGGSANYHNVGLAAAKTALQTAMAGALRQARLSREQISAAAWALAGAGRAEDRRRFFELAAELLPGVPVQVEHDALAALVGGLGRRRGIALIAGTGMIAYGEDGQGQQARAGGWGTLLDQGSGYALGLAALRAISMAADGRDHPIRLAERLLTGLKITTPAEIPNWLYAPERSVADIAALAPQVLAEAARGDMIAVGLAAQGAEALAEATDAVARRLGLWGEPFSLVLSGGLLTSNDFYRRLVAQAIQSRIPGSQLQPPQADPAVGAARLALESLGYPLAGQATVEGASSGSWVSEMRNLLTQNLDLQTAMEIVGLMHLADQQAVAAVRPLLPTIAAVAEAMEERMGRGGRLIYVGAGTSGRLGVLDASECPPTFNADPGQVIGLMAGGRVALTEPAEGAEDDPAAGLNDLAVLAVGPEDSVVGIAASGRTPYIIAALSEARRRGALTVALTCNLPAPLTREADYVIAPLVGPEVVAGSTRLKAGTAQKLVLNMLSTAVMVRLGKTYGNLMVDVQPTNQKLLARARRIVAQACGIDEAAAQIVLTTCEGEVKTAIVSQLLGCSPAEARQRLAAAGGVVRKALGVSLP